MQRQKHVCGWLKRGWWGWATPLLMTQPKGSKHSTKRGLTGHFAHYYSGNFVPVLPPSPLFFLLPSILSLLSVCRPHLLSPLFARRLSLFSVWFSASYLTRFYLAPRSSVPLIIHIIAWQQAETSPTPTHPHQVHRFPSIFSFHFPLCVVFNCLLSVGDKSVHISWRHAKQKSECGIISQLNQRHI